MQKIIYLSPVSFFKGGAERSLFDLMANPNITPILVVPADGVLADKARNLGIKCHILDFGAINNVHRPFKFLDGFRVLSDLYKVSQKLVKIAHSENIKIIHSNGLKAHAINAISKLLGKTKAVLHIRDIPYTKNEHLVWKILCKLSDKFVVVSRACWSDNNLPQKVKVIHNGTPLLPSVSSNIPKSPFKLGFIGRIHPAKGLHLLIDWLVAARAKNIDLHLTIRGEYSDDAPEYEAQITRQIRDNNLGDYIEFTGFISDTNLVYKDIDIVVVPSDTPDPLPRSVMEAMARKLIVFGYPAGGIGEMIIDYKTGFMVHDAKTFINALEFITNNPDGIKTIMDNGLKHIETDFSMENLHRQITKLYDGLFIRN